MPFLPPNQQRQSTEGTEVAKYKFLHRTPTLHYEYEAHAGQMDGFSIVSEAVWLISWILHRSTFLGDFVAVVFNPVNGFVGIMCWLVHLCVCVSAQVDVFSDQLAVSC